METSSTLFPVEPVLPEGFHYYPGLITEAEEYELCKAIAGIELHNMIFQGYTAKRKVASFGYDWNFTSRKLSKGKDIPAAFLPLIEKVAKHLSIDPGTIGELLLTEYPPGSVINWHRDAPPFDLIAGISLLSDCTFKLRPYDKAKQGRGSVVSIPVHKRSLYIMQGPARSDWEHSIPAMKQVRYSITLRTLKEQ